ncbi:MAG: acyl-CoA thioesterase [Bacteroidetes bacterium]|nr:acyl-CoA thioesterase [Bacteroidota bacterium]
MEYKLPLQLRWADIDANLHVRHSVYYDWAALCRISFMQEKGLTDLVYHQFNLGPILLREECRFRREISMGDAISIDLQLVAARKDFSRWTIQHTIWKSTDIEAGRLTVEGAFIDLQLRKLSVPSAIIQAVFEQMPRAAAFQWSN